MVKVTVVGAGNWGINYVKTFQQLGRLLAVVEPNLEVYENIYAINPDIPIYQTVEEALEHTSGAFVVATPTPTHFAIAKKIILNGCDVLIEKPITLSADEAEELVKLAEEKNIILMAGHLLLYQPEIKKIKEMIDHGEIGTVFNINQKRLKLGRVETVENVLWSFGVHDLAALFYFLNDFPTEITVSSQAVLQQGIEDEVHVHMNFPNQIKAHLHCSWLWPEVERKLTVIGSKGMIVFDEVSRELLLYRKGVDQQLHHWDYGFAKIEVEEKLPLTIECEHFLECLERRQKPVSDGLHGLEVIKILETIQRKLKAKETD